MQTSLQGLGSFSAALCCLNEFWYQEHSRSDIYILMFHCLAHTTSSSSPPWGLCAQRITLKCTKISPNNGKTAANGLVLLQDGVLFKFWSIRIEGNMGLGMAESPMSSTGMGMRNHQTPQQWEGEAKSQNSHWKQTPEEVTQCTARCPQNPWNNHPWGQNLLPLEPSAGQSKPTIPQHKEGICVPSTPSFMYSSIRVMLNLCILRSHSSFRLPLQFHWFFMAEVNAGENLSLEEALDHQWKIKHIWRKQAQLSWWKQAQLSPFLIFVSFNSHLLWAPENQVCKGFLDLYPPWRNLDH